MSNNKKYDARENTATRIDFISYTYSISGIFMLLCASITWMLFVTEAWFKIGAPLLSVSCIISMVSSIAFNFIDHTNLTHTLLLTSMLLPSYSTIIGLITCNYIWVLGAFRVSLALSITAVLFFGAAIYGHVAQIDLSSLSKIVGIGLWGLFIATLACIGLSYIMDVELLDLCLAYISIAVFTLLIVQTANTLKVLEPAFSAASNSEKASIAIVAALNLFMAAANIFIRILQIFSHSNKKK